MRARLGGQPEPAGGGAWVRVSPAGSSGINPNATAGSGVYTGKEPRLGRGEPVSTQNALTRPAVLALLALACASGCSSPATTAASSAASPASASTGPASTGPASTGPASTGPASTRWTARTVLRESTREMAADQVADPRVSAVFALAAGSSAAAAQGPFVVERNGIKDGSVRRGPVVPAGGLSLAAGYLWVSEPARSGRAVLVQLDPRTLAVVRTLHVPAAGSAGQPPAGVVPGPGGSVWAAGSRSL